MSEKIYISEIDSRRINNLVWAVNNDYSIDIDYYFLSQDYFDYGLIYNGVFLGLIYRDLDHDQLKDFYMKLSVAVDQVENITNIFFLCLEQAAIYPNINIFSNLENIRKRIYRKKLRSYSTTIRGRKLALTFRRAYIHRVLGIEMVFPSNIISLIDDIWTFKDINSTFDFLESFKVLIEKYFKIDLHIDIDKKLKIDLDDLDLKFEFDDVYDYVGEAEENPKEDIDLKLLSDFMPNESKVEEAEENRGSIYKNKKEKDQLERLENIYGRQIVPTEVLHQIEKKFAVEVHRGHKVYITDGDMSASNDSYRIKTVEESLEKNKASYLKNKSRYDQAIANLKQEISQTKNEDEFIFNVSKGKLMPSQVYKADILNNINIFYKDLRDQEKNLYIDLVLDSSASLLERQDIVAVQAYMISRALEDLKIYNSIKTFNNFQGYTIIKLLKSYEDPQSDAAFKYFSSGGNRDGLALDIIGSMEQSVANSDRIMIVFTDAKPYDVQAARSIGQRKKKAYQGSLAITDTSKVVSKLRRHGTKVYGFYSGEKKDISAMRKIYGTDFIYVEDISRFAFQVGRVISSFIDE